MKIKCILIFIFFIIIFSLSQECILKNNGMPEKEIYILNIQEMLELTGACGGCCAELGYDTECHNLTDSYLGDWCYKYISYPDSCHSRSWFYGQQNCPEKGTYKNGNTLFCN